MSSVILFPRTFVALLLLGFLFSCFGRSNNNRRSVIVLVDESGTLKADHGGWRKEAASLLAESLSDGSSMALSGFGNVGRKLDVALRTLDSSPAGIESRQRLVRAAQMLGDTDQQTDLYGAIGSALAEFERLDAVVQRSAPPALVVLSDFQPDPIPDSAVEKKVCDQIRATGVQFLALGFGQVDGRRMQLLAGCGGELPIATITEPAGLVNTFWLLHRYLTNSLRLFEAAAPAQGSIEVPVPRWAGELWILGTSQTVPASAWGWQVAGSSEAGAGKTYRMARIVSESGLSRQVRVALHGAEGVQLSVVARGDLVLRVRAESPQPWLAGEFVNVTASLIDPHVSQTATEWMGVSKAQSAASLHLANGHDVTLTLDPKSGVFQSGSILAALDAFPANATATIDGAVWDAPLQGQVRSLSVKFRTAGDRVVARAWLPGEAVRILVESALDNRTFALVYETGGALGATHGELRFTAGSRERFLQVNAGTGPAKAKDWLWAPEPVIGKLSLKTVLDNGQIVEQLLPSTVVIEFYPTWLRFAIAFTLGLPLTAFVLISAAGRRLPRWHLVPCDASGRVLASREPLRLALYRRSLALDSFGLSGTRICQPLFGKPRLVLGPNVQLWPNGVNLGTAASSSDRRTLRVGDFVICTPTNGATCAYRVEAF